MDEFTDLEKFAKLASHRLIHKPPRYFDVYDLHCSKHRNKSASILEIGIFHGGSLQMWKHYLGKGSQIWGLDIEEKTKEFEEDQISVRIGDQSDRTFLRKLMGEIGEVDIIIDDGGHTMRQQIVTFEETFPFLKPGGTYICEDVGTSYRQSHGGGYCRPGTFIEYCKMLADKVNIGNWPIVTEDKNGMLNHLARVGEAGPAAHLDAKTTIRSVSFYASMVVMERWKNYRDGIGEKYGTPSY